jgi:transposase InsO family protein
MRDGLPNESLFLDLDQARQIIAAWTADHNTTRLHSSLTAISRYARNPRAVRLLIPS